MILRTFVRELWGKGGTDYVQVHCRLDNLYGMAGSDAETVKRLYSASKNEGDFKAAYEIILRCRAAEKLKALRDVVSKAKVRPLFVYPRKLNVRDASRSLNPERPSNALPVVFARFLSGYVGGEICREIVQVTIRKRTKLNRLVRFIYQPKFKGPVISGRRYVLVDDVISSGALFASLRSHIVRGGGIVIGMTALAHVSGRDQKLAITKESLEALKIAFSDDLGPFWQTKFGHSIELLTDQEAKFLLGRWQFEHQGVPRGSQLLKRLSDEIELIETAHSKFR